MSYSEVLDDGKERMEKSLAHLKDQMNRIRTGRASSALVDNIRVDYYGTPTPISQLGAVSIPEPRSDSGLSRSSPTMAARARTVYWAAREPTICPVARATTASTAGPSPTR